MVQDEAVTPPKAPVQDEEQDAPAHLHVVPLTRPHDNNESTNAPTSGRPDANPQTANNR